MTASPGRLKDGLGRELRIDLIVRPEPFLQQISVGGDGLQHGEDAGVHGGAGGPLDQRADRSFVHLARWSGGDGFGQEVDDLLAVIALELLADDDGLRLPDQFVDALRSRGFVGVGVGDGDGGWHQ